MNKGQFIEGEIIDLEDKDHPKIFVSSFLSSQDEYGTEIFILVVHEMNDFGIIRHAIPYPFRSRVHYNTFVGDEEPFTIYDFEKPHIVSCCIEGYMSDTAYITDGEKVVVYDGWNTYEDGHICYGGSSWGDAAAVLGSWMDNQSNNDLSMQGCQPFTVEAFNGVGIAPDWGVSSPTYAKSINPKIKQVWKALKSAWESAAQKRASSNVLSAIATSREISL